MIPANPNFCQIEVRAEGKGLKSTVLVPNRFVLQGDTPLQTLCRYLEYMEQEQGKRAAN